MKTYDVDAAQRFQRKIDTLKNGRPYQELYADLEVGELMQALDILKALREEVSDGPSDVAWTWLKHAAAHLDKILESRLKAKGK